MRSRKRQTMEGTELPNQEKNLNARRKGNLQVLVNSGSGHHHKSGDETKKEEYLRRTRKFTEILLQESH